MEARQDDILKRHTSVRESAEGCSSSAGVASEGRNGRYDASLMGDGCGYQCLLT
jgi:hypothetical protein